MKISEILDLSSQFWQELAEGSDQCIKKWIKDDALEGIMQDETSGHKYSQGYAKYKANWMQRMTVGKAKDWGYTFDKAGNIRYLNLYFRNKKAKFTQKNPTGTGKRLKAYAAQSLESNDVSKVTMVLTGNTLNGLHYKESDKNSVTLAFNPSDGMKVKGNKEKNGYDIWGLRTANVLKVKQRIIAEYKKQTGELPKTITIDVSKN